MTFTCSKFSLTAGTFLSALFLSSAAMAEPVHRETPFGQDLQASLGEKMWFARNFEGTDGVVIDAPVYAQWQNNKIVDFEAGTELVTIRDNETKACLSRNRTRIYRNIGFKGWDDCLIDEDNDGRFEKATYRKLSGSKPIDPPVPYRVTRVPDLGEEAFYNERELVFLGVADKTMRFAYRTFTERRDSPDFTDELSIPMPASFPASFSIKGRKLTVLAVDSDTIRYRVGLAE
ncbi:MAG: hypothetical protein ACK5NN_08630 [Sphingomonadaceae bacterium]